MEEYTTNQDFINLFDNIESDKVKNTILNDLANARRQCPFEITGVQINHGTHFMINATFGSKIYTL